MKDDAQRTEQPVKTHFVHRREWAGHKTKLQLRTEAGVHVPLRTLPVQYEVTAMPCVSHGVSHTPCFGVSEVEVDEAASIIGVIASASWFP